MAGFNYAFTDACGIRHTRCFSGHKTARFAYVVVIHRGTLAVPQSPRPDDVSWCMTVERANALADAQRASWRDKWVSVFPLDATPALASKHNHNSAAFMVGAPRAVGMIQ